MATKSMTIPPITSEKHLSTGKTSAIPFQRIFSVVEHRHLKFIILDCPTDRTLPLYMEELTRRGVSDVVRVCEPTYDKRILEDKGIKVHDWSFADGAIPPSSILLQFLALCDERFNGLACGSKESLPPKEGDGPVIAVHCVAGLGRAPVLVASALIEAGMVPLDAVDYVRRRRRGAFNSVQLSWLVDSYKRQWKKGKSVSSFLPRRSGSPSTNRDDMPPTTHSKEISPHSTPNLSLKESFGKVFRFRKTAAQVAV